MQKITFDKTPQNNMKYDNSPHTGRSNFEFKIPIHNNNLIFEQDDDNSKGYK